MDDEAMIPIELVCGWSRSTLLTEEEEEDDEDFRKPRKRKPRKRKPRKEKQNETLVKILPISQKCKSFIG